MSYRTEMIQVAAVAVAAVEAWDWGDATGGRRTDGTIAEVYAERERQNEQWGAQTHEPFVWLSILMEEVGEAAQAHLQATFGDALQEDE